MSARSGSDGTPPGLRRLARLHGIQTRYRDAGGRWQTASTDALQATLRALGVEASSPSAIDEAARRRRRELDDRIVRPVTPVPLGGEDEPPAVPVRLPVRTLDGGVECRLRTEDGRTREWRARPQREDPDPEGDRRRAPARIPLPAPVPPGYHELTIAAGDLSAETRLVAAPPLAWRPERPGEERPWGVFLPLYALRSETSWATGDFGDLETLLGWTGRLGGDVVGTLPLLPGGGREPGDSGVYSPLTRLFWNEIYLDVERAPGLADSEEARRILESPGFQKRLRELRDADLVDWRAAAEAKRAVLEPVARTFLANGGRSRMGSFLAARPEVEAYARFRSVRDRRDGPWPRWPDGLREPPIDPGAADDAGTDYHLYVQWLADRQMRRLRESRGESGPGLYLDLPLGCDPGGFDVWRRQELFADGATVGSPPDAFFSEGQDWGFPPPRPEAMERSGFAYTIETLRHHMRFAARLRIDHVMAMHRLFWIPDGLDARDGVYVRYPADALYAVLRVESHRHRTALVGEDLGTVPREVRRALRRNGLDRMHVAQFEVRPDEEPALARPPARSVTSVGTHDTPSFAGFWRGADIEDRLALGLLDAEGAEEERTRRATLRSTWARFLRAEGEAGDIGADAGRDTRDDSGEEGEVPGPGAVLRGTVRHLARSRAALLLVNLEDLWLEERPQNVPGTGPERPNFRRKARFALEEFTGMDRVVDLLREVDRLRDTAPAGRAGTRDRIRRRRRERNRGERSGASGGTE